MWTAILLTILLSTTNALGRSLQQATDLSASPTGQQGAPAATTPAASPDASPDQQLSAAAPGGAVSTVPIQPESTTKRTLQEVNADAPTLTDPNTKVSIRPVATSLLQQQRAAQATPASTAANTQTARAQLQGKGGSSSAQHIGVTEPQDVAGYKELDSELNTGDYFSFQVGARVSTGLFGTGFNFCIDRYISSLPRVGIVIPNPAIYLLPEFQDLAAGLSTTLSLPNLLPHGAYATPTSDGFLIYLPSIQPSDISNFGIRYSIQIGQAFGWDFGYGQLRDICSIGFVLV